MSHRFDRVPWIFAAALPRIVSACALEPGPDAGGSGGTLLYGLSEEQVASLLPLASRPTDLEDWMEIHRQPFDCARYGSLCGQVGPEAAFRITERSYHLGLEGRTIAEIDAFLSGAIDAAAVEWENSPEGAAAEAAQEDLRCNNVAASTNSFVRRVRTEVEANTPIIGTWHVRAHCTYQVWLGGGWGGSSQANLKWFVRGHLINTAGTAYDFTPGPDPDDWQCNLGPFGCNYSYAHHVVSPKLYVPADVSSADLQGYAHCDSFRADLGWSGSAATTCIEN